MHRLLSALIETGLVFRDYEAKSAIALLRAGASWTSASPRPGGARQIAPLLRLAEETEDTIYASVEGGAAVCVAREIGAFPIRNLSLEVGICARWA